MQPVTVLNIEDQNSFRHFVEAMSVSANGLMHVTEHLDDYSKCTLSQIFEGITNSAYNSYPERFPQGPPPPMLGCQCGQHDIENAILEGDIPDDAGNA